VLLCSRTREKGSKAVEELVALQQPGSVELLQLDVTDQASLDAAAQHVRDTHGRVDCIVNNAGTAGAGSTREDLRVCFETNAAGAWFVVETFAELLRKAVGTPRIVNVSSGLGSLALRAQKGSMLDDLSMIQYRASKAALNMMTVDQAVMYGKEGVKVFSYCPGGLSFPPLAG
jgi:NAD(P)-dependent dehydrogenase (short-subunit alcohol dehydrogenase family)